MRFRGVDYSICALPRGVARKAAAFPTHSWLKRLPSISLSVRVAYRCFVNGHSELKLTGPSGLLRFSRIVMQTVLIIIGIWLLINVLFVVVMTPPRKPRAEDPPQSSMGPTFATLERYTHHFEEEEKGSIRHTIIALAMGALLSLTPPLIEALDDIKRLIKTFWKFGGPGDEGSSNGAPSLDDGDYPKDN